MSITSNINNALSPHYKYFLTNRTGVELIDGFIERIYVGDSGSEKFYRLVPTLNNSHKWGDVDITNRTCALDLYISNADYYKRTKYYINVISSSNLKTLLETFTVDELKELFEMVNNDINTDETPIDNKNAIFGDADEHEGPTIAMLLTSLPLTAVGLIFFFAPPPSEDDTSVSKTLISIGLMCYLIYFLYINKDNISFSEKLFNGIKILSPHFFKLIMVGLVGFLFYILFS